MSKNTLKKCTPIILAAMLLMGALTIAIRSELVPASVWRNYMVSRTPINVNAVTVSTINKPIILARTGSVESSTTIPVNTEFSGYISEIFVTEGQPVKAGQPLLKLQQTSGSIRDSNSESTANQETQAAQSSQDNYNRALQEFNRYQKLYELGGISRVQLENAKSRLQLAQEGLAGSQSSAPSTTATTIKSNGAATIEAPIDGTVTGLIASSGKMMQAGQQLMALGSGQELEIVIRVEQPDLYLVNLGILATLEVANQTITGQVSHIYPAVETNKISAFMVHIKPLNKLDGALKPGMPANVRIDTGNSATVLAVPTAAVLQDDQGQKFIYVVDNGIAIRQQVSIGETIGEFTEVTSNISSESMVITSHINEIKNGDAIIVELH